MELPISRGGLDSLGERLLDPDGPTQEDGELLRSVLNAYRATAGDVHDELLRLGFRATPGLTTAPTLLDRLRRDASVRLPDVPDVAWTRLTVTNRYAQDVTRARITVAFGVSCEVRDYRAVRNSGYRAVHVVVHRDGVPIEIQILTELQEEWTTVHERMGEMWGHDIYYGGLPEQPDLTAIQEVRPVPRSEFVDGVRALRDIIATFEITEQAWAEEKAELLGVVRGTLGALFDSVYHEIH
jgi:Region found in RelA / SpoT proteins